MKKKIIWLDDIRNPFENRYLYKYNPEHQLFKIDIIWLKSYGQFVEWIEKNGLPDKICFDHDLGYELDTYPFIFRKIAFTYLWMIGKNPKIAKSGYDACHWLVDYCMDNNIRLKTQFAFQTDNVVGKENMKSLLNNFKKYQAQERCGKK